MSKLNSKPSLFFLFLTRVLAALGIGAVAGLFFLLFLSITEQTEIYLEKLDITYELQEDGSMHVTERWNTVFTGEDGYHVGFKTIEPQGHGETYTLLSVTEPNTGASYLRDDEMRQNETAGYCVQFQSGDTVNFEWYGSFSEETRLFEIQYEVTNAVTLGDDVAEFYWKMVPENFELSVENLTCTVIPPKALAEEDYLVFGHVAKAKDTHAARSGSQPVFTVKGLESHTFAEARVIMERDLFTGGYADDSISRASILAQEDGWARETEAKVQRDGRLGIVDLILGTLLFAVAVILCLRALQKNRPPVVDYISDYYREPPSPLTPAVLSRLYFFYASLDKGRESNAITATILNLSLRRHILIADQKPDILITFQYNPVNGILSPEESQIYNLFLKASPDGKTVTMKQVEKYMKTYQTTAKGYLDSFRTTTDMNFSALQVVDPSANKARSLLTLLAVGMLVLGGIFAVISFALYGFIFTLSGAVAAGSLAFLCTQKLKLLTPEGQKQYVLWQAFGRYMKEFTLLNEKELPALELWEGFLVYATAMGISKQVLKQLKMAYPQLSDPAYMGQHYPYSYLWLMSYSDGGSFESSIGRISSSVQSIQAASTFDSNGGGGGSFSGGGGGGGGFR